MNELLATALMVMLSRSLDDPSNNLLILNNKKDIGGSGLECRGYYSVHRFTKILSEYIVLWNCCPGLRLLAVVSRKVYTSKYKILLVLNTYKQLNALYVLLRNHD